MSLTTLIKQSSKQTAVYWGNPQNDGTGGYVTDDPVEIKCRWEERRELIKDNTGREIISDAKVIVPQSYSIQDEGWMYLGDLDDSALDSASQPQEVSGAYQIKKIEKLPLHKSNSNFLRIAYLSRQNAT